MIVLANGKVITRDPDGTGYLSDGGVVTDGGKIVEVGTTADLKAKYPQAEFVDASVTFIALVSFRTLRTGISFFTLDTLRSLRSDVTLRTFRTN